MELGDDWVGTDVLDVDYYVRNSDMSPMQEGAARIGLGKPC